MKPRWSVFQVGTRQDVTNLVAYVTMLVNLVTMLVTPATMLVVTATNFFDQKLSPPIGPQMKPQWLVSQVCRAAGCH